jgi:hypothetical protein
MRYVAKLMLACGAAFLAPAFANALVRVDIDLSTQSMHVTSSSGESYDWPISSGRAGHLTPTGSYRPVALYRMVHSAKYDNAPMPHSIFFRSQYAIHGTTAVGSLGRPASHGCIRLAPGNAAALYSLVQAEGAVIRIRGMTPGAEMVARRNAHARRSDVALGYAPVRRVRTLREWARDPFAAPW